MDSEIRKSEQNGLDRQDGQDGMGDSDWTE